VHTHLSIELRFETRNKPSTAGQRTAKTRHDPSLKRHWLATHISINHYLALKQGSDAAAAENQIKGGGDFFTGSGRDVPEHQKHRNTREITPTFDTFCRL
jgi:hypothetical protein